MSKKRFIRNYLSVKFSSVVYTFFILERNIKLVSHEELDYQFLYEV